MSQARDPILHHSIQSLDMSVYLYPDDTFGYVMDGIGMNLLLETVHENVKNGWEYVECSQKEDNPMIYMLHFQRPVE